MNWRRPGLIAILATYPVGGAAAAEPAPSYVKDIKPFLSKYCMSCHSGKRARSGYNVETYAGLLKAGRRGALVVPGKAEKSRMIMTLEGRARAMPPRKSPQPRADEVARVRAWIDAGARDDSPGAQASSLGQSQFISLIDRLDNRKTGGTPGGDEAGGKGGDECQQPAAADEHGIRPQGDGVAAPALAVGVDGVGQAAARQRARHQAEAAKD
jgi:hypothetical protein